MQAGNVEYKHQHKKSGREYIRYLNLICFYFYSIVENGAGDGIRTRDLHLGKVSLYQLSHSRIAFTSIAQSGMIRKME